MLLSKKFIHEIFLTGPRILVILRTDFQKSWTTLSLQFLQNQ